MEPPYIILIGGATGIGTSSIASELSAIYPVRGFQRTDSIRQVIRTVIGPLARPELFESTYKAYENLDAVYVDPLSQESNVLNGHIHQSDIVMVGVDGSVARDLKEGINSVYEGVHLLPGRFGQTSWYSRGLRVQFAQGFKHFGVVLLRYEDYADHIIELFIDIEDPDIHRKRFEQREIFSPTREAKKYLDNFDNIRMIRNYLVRSAKNNGIPIVQNDQGLTYAVKQCVDIISEKTHGKFMPYRSIQPRESLN